MDKKVKFSLIALALIAGFVVFRIFLIFSSKLDVATARNTPPVIDYKDTKDWDSDGLSNTEEEYWGTDPFNPDTNGNGFLDGEMVLSGFNPLTGKSLAEEAKLLSKSNVTEGISDLIVAGIMAGDLKETADNTTYNNAIDRISLAVLNDSLISLQNVSPEKTEFNIVEPTNANRQEYLNKATDIIENNLMPLLLKQPQEMNRLLISSGNSFDAQSKEIIKNTYLSYSFQIKQTYQSLYNFPTPSDIFETHKRGLSLLKQLEVHFQTIAFSTDDPLKLLIVVTNLQTVYLETQPILSELSDYARKNNLSVSNSELLNIVNELKNF